LAAKDEEIHQLEELLSTEKKKNEDLERRIKMLETDLQSALFRQQKIKAAEAKQQMQQADKPPTPPVQSTERQVVLVQPDPVVQTVVVREDTEELAKSRTRLRQTEEELEEEREEHRRTKEKLREAELSMGELKEKLTDLTSLLRKSGVKDKELHEALQVSGLHRFMLGELGGVFERLYRDALRRMDKIKYVADQMREKNEEELMIMMNALTNPGSFSMISTPAPPTRTPSSGVSKSGRPYAPYSRARTITPFGFKSRSLTPEKRTVDDFGVWPKRRNQLATWMFPAVVQLRPFFPHTRMRHVSQ
jgi:hypothetical protein